MHYRFFTFWPWGANPCAKVHQTWQRPAAGASPSPCNISARSHKQSVRWALVKFFTVWHWELTPEPNLTIRGDDLLSTEVYHPIKLHRPASTHAGDICYEISCRQTKKHRNSKRYISSMPIDMWGK